MSISKFIISVAVAGIALFLGLPQRTGDPEEVIAKLERELYEALAGKKAPANATDLHHFLTVESVQRRLAQQALAEGAPPSEIYEALTGEKAPTAAATDYLRNLLALENAGGAVAPTCAELERTWQGLTWHNQEKAMATAMIHYNERPCGLYSFVWEDRFTLASKSWNIQDDRAYLFERLRSGAGAAGAGFLVAFLAISILQWCWGFLLNRVREIARAARGR